MPSFTPRIPIRSVAAAWTCLGPSQQSLPGGDRPVVWQSGPVRVLSSLDDALLPDGSGETGPQWHVSVTAKGKRPKPVHLARALKAFGMIGAEEDNHHPGQARHYYLVCDPARRVDCECKASEETVVEPDGYAWTNPKPETGEECRGCEWQRLSGKPCPVHAGTGREAREAPP